MAQELKAQDIYITIRRDATPIARLAVESGELGFGLGVETYKLAGQSHESATGTLEAATLSLQINPRSDEALTLVEYQARKTTNEEGFADLVIDAEASINFRTGRRRVLLPDCVVSDGSLSFGGGTDRSTMAPTLTANGALKYL